MPTTISNIGFDDYEIRRRLGAGGLRQKDTPISRFDFTDAVIYPAPEQLANAEGYHEETGYRRDVYAFGALAYRLPTEKKC